MALFDSGAAPGRLVLFLDDGGVISDNRLRAPQWQALVAAFFAPRLGGSPETWMAANRVVADGLFAPRAWQARLAASASYADFDRVYQLDWLSGMCALVGLPMPPDPQALALAWEASAYITRRVQAALPGAVGALRTLHVRGYTLHTASGESSRELAGYLTAMGARSCFDRLYGGDLVDTLKAGPEYYARIFADAAVAPAAALVVDDSPAALAWAVAAGARAVLVGAAPRPGDLPAWRVDSLAALPRLLAELD